LQIKRNLFLFNLHSPPKRKKRKKQYERLNRQTKDDVKVWSKAQQREKKRKSKIKE